MHGLNIFSFLNKGCQRTMLDNDPFTHWYSLSYIGFMAKHFPRYLNDVSGGRRMIHAKLLGKT